MKTLITLVLACGLGATAARAQTPHPSFDVKVTGQGPAILLIPGLLSAGEVWDSTVERYKDRYTLHVLTLAGFGGPAPVAAPFLSRVRDEVIAYSREQQLQKPVIIGHSLGGFLGFWIAATAPDLVGGLIAVDGVPFLPALGNAAATAESAKAQAGQIKAIYTSFSNAQLVAQTKMALPMMITESANVERAAAWAARSDAATAGLAIAELSTTDLRSEVAAITAPHPSDRRFWRRTGEHATRHGQGIRSPGVADEVRACHHGRQGTPLHHVRRPVLPVCGAR